MPKFAFTPPRAGAPSERARGVDNASASTYDSARRFVPADHQLRYVRLPGTVNVFQNVTGALRRAHGELCMHLADDDSLIPDALADAVAVMRAQPGARTSDDQATARWVAE
ncbi:MAG TPA: glycosyltransferase family A protein [Candidatus Sulfotelmatobacter sp.]|nr:glycosyltransferase family A protein [Candidatus Sulfotelmatobacter sp.]